MRTKYPTVGGDPDEPFIVELKQFGRMFFRGCAIVTLPIWLPFAIVGFLTETWFLPSELYFKRRLRIGNRWLSKQTLSKRLQANTGTLIIDQPTCGWGFSRLWWTEDDVLTIAPVEQNRHEIKANEPFTWDPFDQWIYQRYLDPESGIGFLVHVWNGKTRFDSLVRRYSNIQAIESFSGGQQLEEFSRE